MAAARHRRGPGPRRLRSRNSSRCSSWCRPRSGRDLDPLRQVLEPLAAGRPRPRRRRALLSRRAAELLSRLGAAAGVAGRAPLEDRPWAAEPIGGWPGGGSARRTGKRVKHRAAIDEASPAEDYHELRKKGKELRYMLELFGTPLYPAEVVDPTGQIAEGAAGRAGPPPGSRGAGRVAAVAGRRGGDAAARAAGADGHGRPGRPAPGRRAAARAEFAERFAVLGQASSAGWSKSTFGPSRQLDFDDLHGRQSLARPRSPRSTDPGFQATASYLADPAEVHRVLLLYSGGLDTSVMLKWIQDRYQAEVVALTVNLGQPGEDYDVVKGKACRSARSRRTWSTPARSSRASTCCPRSRPTRSTGSAIRCSPRWGGR